MENDKPLAIEGMDDRTDPMWNKATQDINVPEFVYEVCPAVIIPHVANQDRARAMSDVDPAKPVLVSCTGALMPANRSSRRRLAARLNSNVRPRR